MPKSICQIWTNKSNLNETKIVEKPYSEDQLQAEEVLLQVESLGFSANNITYAVFGSKMGYWGFFPADEHWGIVPMWGFATVLESKHSEIKAGEKVFGYLPMASHLVIKAGNISASHFFDVSDNRKSISPVYDNYVRCANDPSYREENQAWQLNYRPLFMTSFVLDDFVGQALVASEPSIQQVILTSASSKTAYGTAHLLQKNKDQRGNDYQVIGLTSEKNKAFTEQLGCYDKVCSYAEIAGLALDLGTWVLDFAGNKALLLALQQQFNHPQSKIILIGSTDVDAQQHKPNGQINSEFFFAPDQVRKLTKAWGQQGLATKYAHAWQNFSQHLSGKITQANYHGPQQIQALFQQGLNNQLNNQHINVLTF
ncbi:DUF2855 family protein [Paraglaciecola aestuariivivens]